MNYTSNYDSPLGKILLACDDEGLTLVSFVGSEGKEGGGHSLIDEAKRWLDVYFAGGVPDFVPTLNPSGTEFQRRVWEVLRGIPRGTTTTYGAIVRELGCRSAQAVGQAVGRNPISIIIPCHRVLGSDGSLTGYAGGLKRKAELLRLEGVKYPPQFSEGGLCYVFIQSQKLKVPFVEPVCLQSLRLSLKGDHCHQYNLRLKHHMKFL